MQRRTWWCGAAGVALVAGAAVGQQGPRQEEPGMPPGRREKERTSPPPPVDGPNGVQVNTNALGQNIIGDAANEPSLVVDPTAPNRMAVGWRQFDTVTSNFRQAGRAYSVDGGRHWTNPGVLTPGTFRTDPVLDTTADGRFYYYSLYGSTLTTCDLFSSMDHGVSWSPSTPARGGDKNWMAIDRSAGIGRNNIYIIWSPFYSCCGTNNIFARSTDGGQTFGPAMTVPDLPHFGTVAVGPDGEVYVGGVSYADSSMFRIAKSLDAANPAATPTFPLSRPVNLGGVLSVNPGTGPNPGGFGGQAWVAVDRSSGPTRGYVYMLCTVDPPTTDPGDVMIARSTDGGNTWSAPVRINDDPQGPNNWQWMGTLGVAPDGRLDAVWIDTRESQQANIGRLYYSFSRDAGATWSANVPITQAWNSFLGWPQQNKIGEYYQLVSDRVGADLIYAATFNGEQDIYFMRIGDYDCNGNGIPDSTDLATGVLHDCNGNGIPDECEIAAGQVVICACYANCDGSSVAPILNVNDFVCFQQKYAAGDSYANCDGSTTPPVLNVNDFICFQTRYAAGCP